MEVGLHASSVTFGDPSSASATDGSRFFGSRSACEYNRVCVQPTAQVFLVPGAFGFQTIAGLPYFGGGVRQLLRDRLAQLGLAARVHALDTLPTASIESRARYLGERIAALVPDDGSPIHLVGHSTGGLDARVLLSPSTLPCAWRARSCCA
jgi:triacylglycerol esterase/lipase EstA (alpha/beta hydrolase family)